MANNNPLPAAVGDKLEIVITVRAGDEEYSKVFSVSQIKDMQAKGITPLASELSCILCCSQKAGTVACIARCLLDGQCCDGGTSNCVQLP